ncbi:NAD(P)-binding domain-containing protein [Amycolatopsis japonica]|uniref:NAD(P)-dependent oxidoreductase n=1 Tax=Amycolatopsis japonica TaxID=208439 RepID=UPI0033299DB9
MAIKSVTVIGLGGMGGGMAHSLLREGFAVTVFNRSAEKAMPLVRAGAVHAETVAGAVAGADALVLSLADESAVDELMSDEVVSRLEPGTVIVDTTTVSPSYARDAAARLAASGVERLEACVVGNPEMAMAGRLRVFVSGEESTVDLLEPLLSALAQEIRYLGAAGSASALKLALNLLLGVQTAALAEAADFAEASGLGRELLLDVVLNSGWRSPVLGFRAEFMRRRVYRPAGFRTVLMHKDLDLALRQAASYRLPLPLTRQAAGRFETAIGQGRGADDAAVVVEVSA